MSSGSEQISSLATQPQHTNFNNPITNDDKCQHTSNNKDIQITDTDKSEIPQNMNGLKLDIHLVENYAANKNQTSEKDIYEEEEDEDKEDISSASSSNLFQPTKQHMVCSIQSFKAENKKFESKSYNIIRQRITLATNAIQIADNNSQILQEKLDKKRSELSFLFTDIFGNSNSNEQPLLNNRRIILHDRYIAEQNKYKLLNETLRMKKRELMQARLENVHLKQDGQRLYFDQQMEQLRNGRLEQKEKQYCFSYDKEFEDIDVDDEDAKMEEIEVGKLKDIETSGVADVGVEVQLKAKVEDKEVTGKVSLEQRQEQGNEKREQLQELSVKANVEINSDEAIGNLSDKK